MAAKYDLSIHRGTNFNLFMQYLGTADNGITLTGYKASMQMKRYKDAELPLLFVTGSGVTAGYTAGFTSGYTGIGGISLDKNMIECEELIVRVKIKQLNGIETTSASSIKSVNTIKGNSLNINATSASEIDLEAEYETITIDASSTGNVTIKGKTLKLETNASSASSIDASELMSNEVFAEASSASNIKVHAIVKLDAKAESAGTISSVKRPREFRGKETSGGEITIE